MGPTSLQPTPDPGNLDFLRLLAEHWILVPCKPGSKVPAIPWARLQEPDPHLVDEFAGHNWSVKLGYEGLVCIDIESSRGFSRLDAAGGLVQKVPTPWHNTARNCLRRCDGLPWRSGAGAWHVYYSLPKDLCVALPPKLRLFPDMPDVEVQVRDSLALIPPSVVNDIPYEWRIFPNPLHPARFGGRGKKLRGIWPVPMAPGWLIGLLEDIAEGREARVSSQSTIRPSHRPKTVMDQLASDQRVVDALMRRIGRQPVPLGKAFRCPLHQEQRPSAAWWRTRTGRFVLHDFHARSGKEFLDLGEVIYAVRHGHVKQLSQTELAGEIVTFASEEGLLTLVAQEALERATAHLHHALVGDRQRRAPIYKGPSLEAAWEVMRRMFEEAAQRGYTTVNCSVSFFAKKLGVSNWVAWKALKDLESYGLIVPLRTPEEARRNRRGQRYALRWFEDPLEGIAAEPKGAFEAEDAPRFADASAVRAMAEAPQAELGVSEEGWIASPGGEWRT